MPAHRFLSIALSNTFAAEAFHLPLGPGITFLTGACGSWKTFVAHAARRSACVPPPLHPEQQKEYFERYDFGMGKGTASVRVATASGAEYTSSVTGRGQAVLRDAAGNERPGVALDGELFSCQFFAPLEIGQIARSRDALLALFDRFDEVEIRRVEAEIGHAERRFLSGAADLRRLQRELEEDKERTAELPQLEEALKGMQRAGRPDTKEIARAHEERTRRGRERLAISELEKDLAAVRAAMGEVSKDALARIGRGVDASLEVGPSAETLRRAHAAAHRAAAAVEEAARRAHDALAKAEREVAAEGQALASVHAKEDEAYAALVAHDDADKDQAGARERVQRRHDELSLLEKRRLTRQEEYDAKWRASRAVFEEREQLLLRKWNLRQGVVAKIHAGLVDDSVRVDIRRNKDRGAWRALLAEVLKGSRTPAELIVAIAKSVMPSELAAAVREDDPLPIMRVDEIASNKGERARKILRHLRESGRLEEIEIAPVGDVPQVKLRIGKAHKASGKLSSGQACICILVVLLLQASGPIVIDEPEASLDHKYINKVLVPALRAVKRTCQIILVSHHPSLIVLSEPERIYSLMGEDDRLTIERGGTLDEMRDVVEGIDGGRDAFLLRARLYGHRVEA